MVPNVLKFVSIDGLSRYEAWNGFSQPDEFQRKIGVARLHAASINPHDFPVSTRTHQRLYRLFDSYIDPENGNRIFEYREEL